MHLQVHDASALILMATTLHGRVIATAGPVCTSELGAEVAPESTPGTQDSLWRVQIKPGADAVLLIACMLAVGAFQLTDPPVQAGRGSY